MADRGVAVLGLGMMGSALAGALLEAGLDVCVWNRTLEKAEPLRSAGATVARDVADAVFDRDVVVVCLAEHDLTAPLLQDADLVGRCVVQLTAGNPAESRRLDSWLSARGAQFVEGQIMVYPDTVGTEGSRIMYAGSRSALTQAEAVIAALGGAVDLGDEVGSVSGLAVAARTAYAAASVATTLAVEIARSHGAPVDATLAEIGPLHELAVTGVRRSLEDQGPCDDGDVAVTIERLAAGTRSLVAVAESVGLDSGVLQGGLGALERAIEAGHAGAPIGFVAPALHR